MTDAEKFRIAFDRNVKALTRRPSLGRHTRVSTARIRDGLKCEIEEGPWKLTADQGDTWGGEGAAPTPGVFARAALAACIAQASVLWAAQLGVPLTGIEVEVQANSDARGLVGLDNVPPGYIDVRYVVTAETAAPEADVAAVLNKVEAHSPYFNIFSRAMPIRREIRIVAPRT